MDNFVTLDFMLSFKGMIACVIILTQVFKGLFDKVGKHETKLVVFGFAVALGIFAAAHNGDFTTGIGIMDTLFMWLVNTAGVWMLAMKSFELVTKSNKTDGNLIIKSNEIGEEKWEFDVATDLVKIPKQKYLRLKVEPQPGKSQK